MDKFTEGYNDLTLVEMLRADAKAYVDSIGEPDTNDMFTLAYQWQDKKHRHVYDLCTRLTWAADAIEKLAKYAEHGMFCHRRRHEGDTQESSCTCGLDEILKGP